MPPAPPGPRPRPLFGEDDAQTEAESTAGEVQSVYTGAVAYETEDLALEESAARRAAAAQALAETTQNQEIAAEALTRRQVMLRISDVAQDVGS